MVEFNPQEPGTVTAQASSTSTDPESSTANNTGAVITVFIAPAPAPSIAGISPTSGPVGQTVTITGNNLANATAVIFNGQTGSDDDVTVTPNAGGTNTSVSVTVPVGVTFGPISVKTPGGVATSTQTFTPPFALTSFKPANNEMTVARNASVVLSFSQNVPTASAARIRVFSSQVGSLSQAQVVVNNNVVTITPAPFYFKPGETVNVVVPNTVVNGSGQAISNPQTFDFVVATENGTASFGGAIEKTTNANPANEVLGDVDGDGKLDLIVTNYGNGSGTTISILRNTGTNGVPNFANKQDFSVGTGATGPYNIAIGDLDGDGKLDVVTSNDATNNVSVFRNTSTGVGNIAFAAAQLITVGATPYGLFIGDVDGDAKQDIATANEGGNSVSILRNTSTGTGNISFAAKVDYTVGGGPYGVAIADIDQDGKQDIISANSTGNSISVLRNLITAPGAFVAASFATKVDFTTAGFPVTLGVGDLDSDGRPDVVSSNNRGNNVSVLRNISTGVGNIAFATKVDFTVGTGPAGIALGDLNSDGKLDIATSDYGSGGTTGGGNTVSIRLNQISAPGTITAASFGARATVTVGSGPNNVLLGDLDGDGDLDIVTANQGGTGNTTSVRINATSLPPQPLPVELINFVAQAEGRNSVSLTWATAQEKHNAGFVVERSTDGKQFADLGYVAGNGTATVRHDYAWLDDKLPAGVSTLYYRLRQLDSDGTATTSVIRTVSLGAATAGFQVFPTSSVDGKLHYRFTGAASEDAYLDIYTLTGQYLGRRVVGTLSNGAVSVSDLAAGGYIVRYTSGDKSYASRFFVR
ncbi:hypothetical protein B0919_00020 [Hymenobacter sp. CRA2]|nr:hypothetical protein B0919_00020 [Hymenobacter sp. CRA2]